MHTASDVVPPPIVSPSRIAHRRSPLIAITLAVAALLVGGMLGAYVVVVSKTAGNRAADTLLAYGATGSGKIISIKIPTASGMILRAGAYPMNGWTGHEVCGLRTEASEAAAWREALRAMERSGSIERDWTIQDSNVEVWLLTSAGHRRAQSLPNFPAIKAEVESAKAQTADRWHETIERLGDLTPQEAQR